MIAGVFFMHLAAVFLLNFGCVTHLYLGAILIPSESALP